MKKLLSLLGTFGLIVPTSTLTVISCRGENYNRPDGAFQLASNSIEIDAAIRRKSIEILNFNILEENSYPTEFVFSEENIIDGYLDKNNGEIIFVLENTEVVDKTIAVEISSKNNFKATVSIEIVKPRVDTVFELDVAEISTNTNTIFYINVTNMVYLESQQNWPVNFNFNFDDFATTELDLPNNRIIVRTNSRSINQLVLSISSADEEVTRTVNIRIDNQVIDLSNTLFVTNILAGKLTDGVIDISTPIGQSGFIVNNESILENFNTSNNINLTLEDVNIDFLNGQENSNSMGDSYTISAANSSVVSGSVEIIINQNVDPDEVFANRHLGNVRVFDSLIDQMNFALASNEGKTALFSILMASVGSLNRVMEYIKATMTVMSGQNLPNVMAAMTMAAQSDITMNRISVQMPSFGGLFIERNIDFTFNFIREDRITLLEGLKDQRIDVTEVELQQALSNSTQHRLLQRKIYNSLSEEFRQKVFFIEFQQFTRLTSFGGRWYFDVLPGGQLLYGMDPRAFFFISFWWDIEQPWEDSHLTPEQIVANKPDDRFMVPNPSPFGGPEGWDIFNIIS